MVSGRERVNLNAALNAVSFTQAYLDETDCVNAHHTKRLYRQRLAAYPQDPVYVVRDTREALGALAHYRRQAWGKPVIAVGGSNGKTSTKAMLAAMLAGAYDVHATIGNLNNEIGVPLTLLSLPDDADVAVVEAGTNSPGEIARLRAMIAPDVTVITSIGEEHLEGFGDLAGVLKEELALTSGVPVVVTPAAHPEVAAGVTGDGQQVVVAGLDDGHLQPLAWRLEADGTGTLTFDDGDLHIPLRGAHNLRNAMLAVTVARGFGVTLPQMQFGLSRMMQPSMRAAVDTVGSARYTFTTSRTSSSVYCGGTGGACCGGTRRGRGGELAGARCCDLRGAC